LIEQQMVGRMLRRAVWVAPVVVIALWLIGGADYGISAAAGLALTIFFYIAVNLMMVMGLAPVVGIPLPLVSYGGSAMLTVMICLGVLMSIDRSTRRDKRV